jgi:hypothetical protein
MIPIALDAIGSLAVVGIAKNVGKTTLINQVTKQTMTKRQLGFVSLGIDGEDRDAWSGLPKPAVTIPAGSWLATSRSLIQWEEECWDYVEGLGSYTLMGELVVAHTTADIEAKLAGVGTLQDLERVLRLFQSKQLFALVDGAYDRKSFARPTLTEAMILVVGGTAGRDEDEIIRKSDHWLQQANLPVCIESYYLEMFYQAKQENHIWGIRNGKSGRFPFPSLSSSFRELRNWEVLGVPGALTDKTLRFFMDHQWYPTLILSDMTHLFVSDFVLKTFLRKGGRIEFLQSIQVKGVAINPTTPAGKRLDGDKLISGIKQAARDIPVWEFKK